MFYSLTFSRPAEQSISICIMLQQKKQAIDLIPGQILPYPCHIGFYVYRGRPLPGEGETQQLISPSACGTIDMKNVPLDMKWKNCYKGNCTLLYDTVEPELMSVQSTHVS